MLSATPERSLEEYLHAHIPLSGAMQVRAIAVSAERVVLAAPLAPNIKRNSIEYERAIEGEFVALAAAGGKA